MSNLLDVMMRLVGTGDGLEPAECAVIAGLLVLGTVIAIAAITFWVHACDRT